MQLASRVEGNLPTRKRRLPPRQLLVCTLCRERKVKCDRTKPCFACCARGEPNACRFVVSEGSDYEPIKQSYTIRDLRREVENLKEQLREALEAESHRVSAKGRDTAATEIDSSLAGPKRRRLPGTQPSATTYDRTHTVGFFIFWRPLQASLELTVVQPMRAPFSLPSFHHYLRHLEKPVAYPFPSLPIDYSTTAALVRLLPAGKDIFASLEVFHSIAQSFAVPQPPDKTRKKEVQQFLSDVERNATKEPDMLGLLFAALALVLHMSVFGRRRNWSNARIKTAFARGQCYMAASMQALRNASFMSEPTLVGIKTLLILGVALLRTGRAHNASALFGTTVRLAYSLDMHRDPHAFTPRLTPTECQTRRSLWWLMLHSDQHLSHTLCSPLTISCVGDCPQPTSFTSNPLESRVAYVVYELTMFGREISTSRQKTTAYDTQKKLSRLEDLWQSMPETLRFEVGWSQSKLQLPDWPFEIISARIFADLQYMIILIVDPSFAHISSLESSNLLQAKEAETIGRVPRVPTVLQSQSPSVRARIINACVNLLHAFLFLWNCSSNVQVSHSVESRAITAVTILMLGKSAGTEVEMPLIDEVYSVFLEMQRSGVSRIAAFAIARIARLRRQSQQS